MADLVAVLSIISASLSVTFRATAVGKAIHELQFKYNKADREIRHLATTIKALRAAANSLSKWLQGDEVGSEHVEELKDEIISVLEPCAVVLLELNEYLIRAGSGAETLGLKGRVKLLWDDGILQNARAVLHEQTQVITVLLLTLQTVRKGDQVRHLYRTADAASLHIAKRPASSVFGVHEREDSVRQSVLTNESGPISVMFDFDAEILSSDLYRKQLATLMKDAVRAKQNPSQVHGDARLTMQPCPSELASGMSGDEAGAEPEPCSRCGKYLVQVYSWPKDISPIEDAGIRLERPESSMPWAEHLSCGLDGARSESTQALSPNACPIPELEHLIDRSEKISAGSNQNSLSKTRFMPESEHLTGPSYETSADSNHYPSPKIDARLNAAKTIRQLSRDSLRLQDVQNTGLAEPVGGSRAVDWDGDEESSRDNKPTHSPLGSTYSLDDDSSLSSYDSRETIREAWEREAFAQSPAMTPLTSAEVKSLSSSSEAPNPTPAPFAGASRPTPTRVNDTSSGRYQPDQYITVRPTSSLTIRLEGNWLFLEPQASDPP